MILNLNSLIVSFFLFSDVSSASLYLSSFFIYYFILLS
nr:MAG TPA: hypothetical protein [Caudoviricetes sp.]DAX92839.1 MAG TPA: hypothetical protein [Caudoviricetes sp.]